MTTADPAVVPPPTATTTVTVLGAASPRRRNAVLVLTALASLWYFGWLLQPTRIGNPWLYGLLVLAEIFNLVQASGFWWTLWHDRRRPGIEPAPHYARVDVFVPRYNEPVEIVEPVLRASMLLQGADVTVHLLDDGKSAEMADLAARLGVRYLTREDNRGAKAGNINAALTRTDGEFVVVLDCDHVPHPQLLRRTLGRLADPTVAFVQTPQYYANADRNPVAATAWAQQALFFGCIARGKAALGAMFCCGTNVVFRRTALEQIGGFPTDSVTEDFALSTVLHERGWKSDYVAEVLVQGLGPEDMASYVSQQLRWSRGCLSALAPALRSRLPLVKKLQYVLSSMYFLTGWTVLAYLSLPVIRILTGEGPLESATAADFLLHFAPYFGLSILVVAIGSAGTFTFTALALASASYWVHVVSSIQVLLRRRGRFVVTPKVGSGSWQPLAVWPGLATCAVLVGTALYGLSQDRSAGMLNNVAFALLHVCIIGTGISWALRPAALAEEAAKGLPEGEARWGADDGLVDPETQDGIRRLVLAP